MAEKKQKKKRRAYLDHFRLGANGEYIYTGAYCAFDGDAAALRAWRLRLGLSGACAAAALLGAGLLPAPGATDRFYVILPLLAALSAAFACAWKTVRLLAAGASLRSYVRDAALTPLPRWALAGAIACGVTLAAECACLVFRGFAGKTAAALGFLALCAAACAAFLLLRRAASAARWTEKN